MDNKNQNPNENNETIETYQTNEINQLNQPSGANEINQVNQVYSADETNHVNQTSQADYQSYQQTDYPYQAYQPYATGAPHVKQKVKKAKPEKQPGQKRFGHGLGFIAGLLAACIIGGAAGGMIVYNTITPTLQQFDEKLASLQSEVNSAPIISTGSTSGNTSGSSTTGTATQATNSDLTVSQIADLASPAVVAIGTQAMQETIMGYQTVMAAGSGVIISKDGYIVTNNHVVEGATETTVTLSNGEEYDAVIVGTDPTSDLAVIKIDADVDLPFLSFGDSTELQVGETVVAIGNPLGEFEGTVTSGVVSGKNRTITIDDTTMLNLIQTDAAINSGNSGGALLNLRGEVIGINSAKTSAVGVEGIAFAIPSEVVIPLAEQLIEFGEVTRPMLGITGSPVPQNNYGLPRGVMVYEVLAGSSAQKAGVKKSDIITAVNGNTVTSVNDINAYKAQLDVGDTMSLSVYRDGQEIVIDVVLEAP